MTGGGSGSLTDACYTAGMFMLPKKIGSFEKIPAIEIIKCVLFIWLAYLIPFLQITKPANGLVVKITTDGIYTFSYGALPTGIQTVVPWTALQPPSGRPRIQTPLLACTSSGSALYAIAQGFFLLLFLFFSLAQPTLTCSRTPKGICHSNPCFKHAHIHTYTG